MWHDGSEPGYLDACARTVLGLLRAVRKSWRPAHRNRTTTLHWAELHLLRIGRTWDPAQPEPSRTRAVVLILHVSASFVDPARCVFFHLRSALCAAGGNWTQWQGKQRFPVVQE